MGPHIRTFLNTFAPRELGAASAKGLFGLRVPTTADLHLVIPQGEATVLGNRTMEFSKIRRLFTSGTWRDLFARTFDQVYIPGNDHVDLEQLVKWPRLLTDQVGGTAEVARGVESE